MACVLSVAEDFVVSFMLVLKVAFDIFDLTMNGLLRDVMLIVTRSCPLELDRNDGIRFLQEFVMKLGRQFTQATATSR